MKKTSKASKLTESSKPAKTLPKRWFKHNIKGEECYSLDPLSKSIYKHQPEIYDHLSILDMDLCDDSLEERRLYHVSSSGHAIYKITETSRDLHAIPSGIYDLVYIRNRYDHYFIPRDHIREELRVELTSLTDLQNELDNFIKNKDTYTDLNMTYKEGVLLYGPPGTGKTTAINAILHRYISDDVLIININNYIPLDVLNALRDDPRLKIVIFEELTSALDQDSEASQGLLNFLDGENSIDNCFIIATTNYPERLPENITDRPGRFDKLYRVGYLDAENIVKYLSTILNIKVQLEDAKQLKSMAVAHLKSLALYMKKENMTLLEAYKKVQDHKELAKTEFKETDHRIGFNIL